MKRCINEEILKQIDKFIDRKMNRWINEQMEKRIDA